MASLIIQIKDRVVQTHPITKVDTTLGRAPGNDVVIDNMSVSDFHASLCYEDENFYVHDRGSTNGIFVDGCHVLQAPVRYGETFGIGKFSILLTPEGGAPIEALENPPPTYAEVPGDQPRSTFFMKPVDVAQLMEAKEALGIKDEKPAAGLGVVTLILLILVVIGFTVFMVLMLTGRF